MKTTLYFSDNGKIKNTLIDVSVPDVDTIESSLATSRSGVRNEFKAFKTAWQNDYAPKLSMSAALVPETPAFLRDTLLPVLPEGMKNTFRDANIQKTFCGIWTLGPELDALSDELMRDNLVWAFFLDVAATNVLLHLHARLLTLIPDFFSETEKYSIAEYYPGSDLAESGLVPYIADRAIEIGFPAQRNKYGMIQPKKSQCAIILCGENADRIPKMPCGVCLGAKCTYHQLGGCHMGRDWLKTGAP